jgi:hypothetical protein
MDFKLCECENLTQASSLFSTQDVISRVQVTMRLIVYRFSMAHSFMRTSVNFNNLVIKYKEYFMVYNSL